jgi:CRISPR-associated protein (TIGR03984 family)
MMERAIKPIGYRIEPLDISDFSAAPENWFQKQLSVGKDSWFLAHADDGIIWGGVRNGQLIVSSSVFPEVSPPLRTLTLQQARLFGEQAEVRVWRGTNGFRACRVQDESNEEVEAFDEEHLLWGTKVDEQKNGFALLADGRQGLRHAAPLDLATVQVSHPEQRHPLRLRVRHYLGYDDDGRVRITMSRLVTLGYHPGGKQQ